MGDSITNLGEADALLPKENVYRGLNQGLFHDGKPTSANFVMRKNHEIKQGPSHLICGLIPKAKVPRFLPPPKWLIVELNVGEMLNPPSPESLSDRGVKVIPLRDEFFEEFADAHAVLTGYQELTNKEIGEFTRYLAQLATKAMTA